MGWGRGSVGKALGVWQAEFESLELTLKSQMCNECICNLSEPYQEPETSECQQFSGWLTWSMQQSTEEEQCLKTMRKVKAQSCPLTSTYVCALAPPHIKVWMVSYFCKESLSAYFRPLWPCSVCIIYNQLCHCGHKAIMDSKQASEHSSKLYWQEQTASNVAWTLSTLIWKIGYFSDFIQEHTVMNSVLHEPNQYTGHWSDSSRLS